MRFLLLPILLLPLTAPALAQMKFVLQYQDQFGKWHRYQEKHNEGDAYRTAKAAPSPSPTRVPIHQPVTIVGEERIQHFGVFFFHPLYTHEHLGYCSAHCPKQTYPSALLLILRIFAYIPQPLAHTHGFYHFRGVEIVILIQSTS